MKRCNTKHMRFKGYADGGKVVKSEYGEPTYPRAVMARVGVGDGYGNPKSSPKPKEKRMNVGNAAVEFGNVMAKRKKMLDET